MILVTGGLGFIGSHTTRALLDTGEDCIVTQHHKTAVPDFLQAEIGTRVVIEPVDITDGDTLRAIGLRHSITGVVHLADSAVAQVVNALRATAPLRFSGLFMGLGNILDAASEWGVHRLTIASTIGVYGGVGTGPWREDMSLPPTSAHGIPAMKKISETLASFAASQAHLPVVCVRLSGIWGPGGRSSSLFFALPALVHAATRTDGPTATDYRELFAEDGSDLCYVKDCAKAIALLQVAPTLNYSTYNVGGGGVTTNAEVVASIRRCVPGFDAQLSPGRSTPQQPTDAYLDLARLREDTGYEPGYSLDDGIAEYIGWLRAGHEL
ncbi:MAG: NAD(P)-dependent oxidoreductase [Chloroflexi bacterium]|nr:NAD(P)-dependent oxidoreductase [Chloroflexota bacterium]